MPAALSGPVACYPLAAGGFQCGPPRSLASPADGLFPADVREPIIGHTLLKRLGDPEAIARAVLFLAADAPYVTGQIIAVDGGRSINI